MGVTSYRRSRSREPWHAAAPSTRRGPRSGVRRGSNRPFTLAIRRFSNSAFCLVRTRVAVGPPVFTARMTNPMENPEDPPPEEPENENPENEFAELDAREALFTAALQQADQVANRAEAMRRQVMLVGFDAMVLEEQVEGRIVHMDDVVVRAFVLHQSTVLRLPRQTVLRQLSEGWTLRDRLPNTWAVFLDGLCSTDAAAVAASECDGLEGEALTEYDRTAAQLVQELRPTVLLRKLATLRDRLDPDPSSSGTERRASGGTSPAGPVRTGRHR